MDSTKFEVFRQACSEHLAGEIGRILKGGEGKTPCAIGFITTDDFYGCYLTWNFTKDLGEYYGWKQSSEPEFLYQPLVDVVEACPEIDLCEASDEKWDFAQTFLSVLADRINQIPEEVFAANGYRRGDVLFFATMSDGDYMKEMLDASVEMFNSKETTA